MTVAKKGLAAYLEAMNCPDPLFGDIQKHVLAKATHVADDPDNRRRIDCIHPSEAVKSDWCIRSNYHRIMTNIAHNPRQTSFRLENVFQEGHNTHSKWQRWMAEMYKLSGDWRCDSCGAVFFSETTPTVCPDDYCGNPEYTTFTYEELRLEHTDLRISGRTDGHIPDENMLVEIKTLGIGSLRYEEPEFLAPYEKYSDGKSWIALDSLWNDFRRPLRTARRQGCLYVWLAQQMGLNVDKILFIYDFKPTQEAKSFLVHFKQDVIQDILDNCGLIADCINFGLGAPQCNIGGVEMCAYCRPYEIGEEA